MIDQKSHVIDVLHSPVLVEIIEVNILFGRNGVYIMYYTLSSC